MEFGFYGFLSGEKRSRRETSRASSTTIRGESFSHFGELWPRGAVWWDLRLADALVRSTSNPLLIYPQLDTFILTLAKKTYFALAA